MDGGPAQGGWTTGPRPLRPRVRRTGLRTRPEGTPGAVVRTERPPKPPTPPSRTGPPRRRLQIVRAALTSPPPASAPNPPSGASGTGSAANRPPPPPPAPPPRKRPPRDGGPRPGGRPGHPGPLLQPQPAVPAHRERDRLRTAPEWSITITRRRPARIRWIQVVVATRPG